MDIIDILLHLFNVSISASFLALAVFLFRFIFNKAPKWLIVVLWAFVAIRLICPFSIESTLSLIPSAEVIPPEILNIDPTKTPDTAFGIVENPVYDGLINSTVVVDDVESFQLDFVFASIIWLFGVVLLLLYAFLSYMRLKHTVRISVPLNENVCLCDNVQTPFILGVFRPKIYLPSDMDEQRTEFVLAHEKAHLKRKDHIWKPLGYVLLSVYWFNPVLWLSYILLCRDIELACDEKVIKDMENAEKRAYSEALLSCSVPQKMITACPVAFGEVGVKKRIKGVLNYKKPAFWIVVIAVVVSIVLALCFMTDPKSKNGESLRGVDEIAEISFPMKDLVFGAPSYTIYEKTDTTDNYFDAKIEDMFSYTEVSSFLDHLMLSELPEGAVNPMLEPETNGVIKMQPKEHAPVRIIFHDNFQKMYMQKRTEFYSVRSKDYAVLEAEQAREFFTGKPYMNHSLVWEFNPASSAWGHGEINVFVDKKCEISGDVTGDGTISRISDEEKGQGISWRPDIIENPGEYNIEIPVICDGEYKVFNFAITMVGKRGLSTYYTLRADDLVVASYPDGYSFELSNAETKENDVEPLLFYELVDPDVFDTEQYINLMMTNCAFIKDGEKEAVVYKCDRIISALGECEFKKGYYSHPSADDLSTMKKYSIEVEGDEGETYAINFDKNCSVMWFSDSNGDFSPTFKLKNSKTAKSFFKDEKFFDDAFIWKYNSSANTYALNYLNLIVEGEYESYTATCERGMFRTAEIKNDRTGGIVQSEATKKITCTKDDNLVWQPDITAPRYPSETIHVEMKLANGNTNDFYVYVSQVGTDYSGNTLCEITADYADVVMMKKGNNISFKFEQTYDVTWLYNPMAGATWFYISKYVLPTDYQIKSVRATSGTATIENLYYNEPDKEKCVNWSPDEYSPEDAELIITAIKGGKEVQFRIFMNFTGDFDDSDRKKYIISPVNCKIKEEQIATFFIEEK